MAVNIGGISQQNIFTPKTAGIVSDSELTSLAKEILSATPTRSNISTTQTTTTNNTQNVKFYESGFDTNAVRQAATNRTGLDVNLSQGALSSINQLNAAAAKSQVSNVAKAVDGKIHINQETTDFTSLKSVFASTSTNIEVFNSNATDKDKKGSDAFYMSLEKSDEDKDEGINIVG